MTKLCPVSWQKACQMDGQDPNFMLSNWLSAFGRLFQGSENAHYFLSE
jgi:hypothetical protein